MQTLVIFADASPRIGTGHVMRCIALAQAVSLQGIYVQMIGRVSVAWVQDRLVKENLVFTPMQGEVLQAEQPAYLIDALEKTPKGAWVVVDGYHFGVDCQKAVREAGYKLLVIDDYCHLSEYSCDMLLNQNMSAKNFAYKGDIGKLCLGLDYVLLRQEFVLAREKALSRPRHKTPQNILLTLGGGDFSKHLAHIAPALTIAEMTGKTLRVIAGAMSEENIRQCLQYCPAKVEILSTVEDMPALLSKTDIIIGAGGGTCWEAFFYGIPMCCVAVAENQVSILKSFYEKKLIAYLGNMQDMKPNELKNALSAFINKSALLQLTQQMSYINIDGLGGQRIARHILEKSYE